MSKKKEDRIVRGTPKRVTKKEIAIAIQEGYVVFHNISWDKDGQSVELPKSVAVPKEKLSENFDFELEGADYLSDIYGWCVKSFQFSK